MSTELKNLQIDEASGVDAPAHGIPGWIVMKSEDAAPQAAAETQLATVYTAIGSAACLSGAPENVRKAAEELFQYTEAQLSAPAPEPTLIEKMKGIFKGTPKVEEKPVKKSKKGKVAPPDGTDDVTATQDSQDVVAKTVKKALKKEREAHAADLQAIAKAVETEFDGLREVMKALLDRVEAVENELVGSYQVPGQDFEPVAKSGATLTDAVMSAFAGNRVTLS